MPLIIRAIITGFGYKIGAELGRYVSERIGLKKAEKAGEPDFPEGLTGQSPDGDGDDGDDGDGESAEPESDA